MNNDPRLTWYNNVKRDVYTTVIPIKTIVMRAKHNPAYLDRFKRYIRGEVAALETAVRIGTGDTKMLARLKQIKDGLNE